MQEFQMQAGKYPVKITFSKDASSPTIEEALVKILSRKLG